MSRKISLELVEQLAVSLDDEEARLDGVVLQKPVQAGKQLRRQIGIRENRI
jgi:hypothetical protein